MKADMAAMKEKSASSSDSGTGGRLEGPRDLDRPPKIPKIGFPPLRRQDRSDALRQPVRLLLPLRAHHGGRKGMAGFP